MPRPPVDDDTLYEIAMYLAIPEAKTEIHAELPNRQRSLFERTYKEITGLEVPSEVGRYPYYVWPDGTNKYGKELRIYFARVPPEPPPIRWLYTDYGSWRARQNRYRINHSKLVMQLFKCGFVLGVKQDQERIREFMKRQFPSS